MQKNNTSARKRMTSIARKLHRSLIRKKISMYTGFLIFFFHALLLVGWLASLGIPHLWGKIHPVVQPLFPYSLRKYTLVSGSCLHCIRSKEKILLKVPLADLIIVLCITTGILFLLQLLFICFSYAKESKKIRQIL